MTMVHRGSQNYDVAVGEAARNFQQKLEEMIHESVPRVERVKEAFSSADVEKLPPGQTAWQFSNAVSWLANEVEDDRRRLELQELAGTLLAKAA